LDHGDLDRSDPVVAISTWYYDHCNGDWEHEYGVRISTLDNPGWCIEIDLQGTELEGKRISRSVVSGASDSWLEYWSDGKTLGVACGPKALKAGLAYMAQLLREY
jgi:hypothetical protein